MTDRNKFEEMLERLVNEDREGAEELFHDIVVEKSREIYSSMLESEMEEEDEAEGDEVEEGFDLEEFEVEADDEMGGDMGDKMMGAIEMGDDEMGMDDEGEEGDVEDRVEDLEDALDELKAEFEKMMSGEESDDEESDDEESDDEESDDEEETEEDFAFEADDEDEDDNTVKSASEQMREYVEKLTPPKGENNTSVSPVAKPNNKGGKTVDPTVGGEETGRTAPSAQEDDADNVNVPGGNASKSMSKQSVKSNGEDAGTNTKSAL